MHEMPTVTIDDDGDSTANIKDQEEFDSRRRNDGNVDRRLSVESSISSSPAHRLAVDNVDSGGRRRKSLPAGMAAHLFRRRMSRSSMSPLVNGVMAFRRLNHHSGISAAIESASELSVSCTCVLR
jgi:hypothetical protein